LHSEIYVTHAVIGGRKICTTVSA